MTPRTQTWLADLPTNPLPTLLAWEDTALQYFIQRDLLETEVEPINSLWELPEAARLVKRQGEDGSWKYPGKTIDPEYGTNYFLLETYKTLRLLVENYGFDRTHHAVEKAAAFLFSCQTPEGDMRGIIGKQYMPYYHGALLELLVKAGYVSDSRVSRGLDWLLSMRQDDGGWIVPAQLVPAREKTGAFWKGAPLPPDRTQPHAHLATGMILRGFAVHPDYRECPEVIAAGIALKRRFFHPDKYNDRKARAYWFKFQYPFWWSNLLTALDTLSKLGFTREDPDIARGLDWFFTHQEEDGLWPTGYGSGTKAESNRRWVGLAICRVLKSYPIGD